MLPSYSRNLFPENLVQACFQQVQTIYVPKKREILPPSHNDTNITTTIEPILEILNATNETDLAHPMKRALQFKDGMNVLGEFLFSDVYSSSS